MKPLSKLCALGVLCFGFGVSASAQTGSSTGASMDRPSTSAPSAQSGANRGETMDRPSTTTAQPSENPRQREFQHPMLEHQPSTEMRGNEEDRIQRRGMQETRRDGEIQRHAMPGAAERQEGNVTDRRAGGKPSN